MRNLLFENNSAVLEKELVNLPLKFTNPFFYTPNPLCVEASGEVISYINSIPSLKEQADKGKMFGVLVVETPFNEIGYLAAFSGNLCDCNNIPFFVPPVFDLLDKDGFFKSGEAQISKMNREISEIENSAEYLLAARQLENYKKSSSEKIASLKQQYKASKTQRDRQRTLLQEKNLLPDDNSGISHSQTLEALVRQSQFQKAQIKRAEREAAQIVAKLQTEVDKFTSTIERLRQERKVASAKLQFDIFEHFVFGNWRGESCTLNEIFKGTAQRVPPAGAGECAAPKLLQYALLNNLRPVAMAEFWLGESPKSLVRVSGNFYPSCKGKCEPILNFMLKGLDVEIGKGECGLDVNKSSAVEVIYEDDYLIAVNKISGMPSVPGKIKCKSVIEVLKEQYPHSSQFTMVHRLDMDTSGILLVAKNLNFFKQLQKQFAQRSVHKEYIALLGGIVESDKGEINLPLSADYEHRPSQMVDFVNGKEAVTKFEVLERDYSNNITKVKFIPITGRTHQLRMHAAHKMGLNAPIIGDSLYGGKQSGRLMLHASKVEFLHPITGEKISLHKDPHFLEHSEI